MRIEYNKLIRDKIPDIIQKDGKHYQIEIMPENEYRKYLLNKLVEESQEIVNAKPDKLDIELADMLEVIDAIMVTYGISEEDVTLIKKQRREERGAFSKRIKLLWTDDSPKDNKPDLSNQVK